jgi:hypothetical protein
MAESASVYLNVFMVLIAFGFIGFTWYYVAGSPWENHLKEWLNIGVRIMHFTFGIAWIGASFYFVWLENALNRTKTCGTNWLETFGLCMEVGFIIWRNTK